MFSNNVSKQNGRGRVQDVANINKIKFGPSGDFFYQNFFKFNKNLINTQDLRRQIENGGTTEAEYPNKSDSEGK